MTAQPAEPARDADPDAGRRGRCRRRHLADYTASGLVAGGAARSPPRRASQATGPIPAQAPGRGCPAWRRSAPASSLDGVPADVVGLGAGGRLAGPGGCDLVWPRCRAPHGLGHASAAFGGMGARARAVAASPPGQPCGATRARARSAGHAGHRSACWPARRRPGGPSRLRR